VTTAIALETSKGDLSLALPLGMILIVLSMAVSGDGDPVEMKIDLEAAN